MILRREGRKAEGASMAVSLSLSNVKMRNEMSSLKCLSPLFIISERYKPLKQGTTHGNVHNSQMVADTAKLTT